MRMVLEKMTKEDIKLNKQKTECCKKSCFFVFGVAPDSNKIKAIVLPENQIEGSYSNSNLLSLGS